MKWFVFKVVSENGIHARPASVIVGEAIKYQSEVCASKLNLDNWTSSINLKSITKLLSLAVTQGAIVKIVAEGEDEEIAITNLKQVIMEHKNNFLMLNDQLKPLSKA